MSVTLICCVGKCLLFRPDVSLTLSSALPRHRVKFLEHLDSEVIELPSSHGRSKRRLLYWAGLRLSRKFKRTYSDALIEPHVPAAYAFHSCAASGSATAPRTPPPLTRSSASRGSASATYRAAKSGPVFPISAPGGTFGQTRIYSTNNRAGPPFVQQGSSSLVDLGSARGGSAQVRRRAIQPFDVTLWSA